jgi:hypothetical protein
MEQEQCTWVAELGRMASLQLWLSVPGELLEVGWAWLGSLQQLRVLVACYQGWVLCRWEQPGLAGGVQPGGAAAPAALQVQVLGVHGRTAQQAAR